MTREERDELIEISAQEPYGDCVSRRAVLDTCLNMYFNGYKVKDLIHDIKNLPPVRPQYTEVEIQKVQELEQAEIEKAYELGKAEQLKTGHWIIIDDCEQFVAKCSRCGRIEDSRMISKYPYCHCGAKMEGREE